MAKRSGPRRTSPSFSQGNVPWCLRKVGVSRRLPGKVWKNDTRAEKWWFKKGGTMFPTLGG